MICEPPLAVKVEEKAFSSLAVSTSSEPVGLDTGAFSSRTLLAVPSARVKCVDTYPSNPWVLTALYDGHVNIYDYQQRQQIKTFALESGPVRSARFIVRMNWIVACSDDYMIRVIDMDTNAVITKFEAHNDYIRALEVHETLPYVISCGDDQLIKVWDWSKDWACVQAFQGHAHYVMDVALRPAQSYDEPGTVTIASASLDSDLKIWSLEAGILAPSTATTTLRGHSSGVNAVAFNADGSLLFSGSDDQTVVVWDLADICRPVVRATLSGHTNNVTAVAIHPSLPLALSAAEDNTVRVWDTITFECVAVWSHELGRAWTLRFIPSTSYVAIGYDQGTVVDDLALDDVNYVTVSKP